MQRKTLMAGAGWLNLSLLLCCAGCSSLPPVQAPPAEIRFTEVRYVGIPTADTTPCPGPKDLPPKATNKDLAAHDTAESARAICDEKLMADTAKKSGQPVVPAGAGTVAAPTAASTTPPQPRP